MSDKDEKRIARIRERILKSGFPLEIEIGNLLRESGWIVGNQWPYVDKNSGKIRPVDVLAMRFNLQPPKLGVSLLIECKKSQKHDWIFHTQQKRKQLLPFLGVFIDFLRKFENISLDENLEDLTTEDVMASKLSDFHHLDMNIRIGVYNLVSSKKDKDDFFIATNQIVSALKSLSEDMKSFVAFPVIVFDGDMFEFYKEGNETVVLPVDHIQYMTYEIAEDGMLPCLIEVVKKDYFPEFLHMINNDFNILTHLVRSKGDQR